MGFLRNAGKRLMPPLPLVVELETVKLDIVHLNARLLLLTARLDRLEAALKSAKLTPHGPHS